MRFLIGDLLLELEGDPGFEVGERWELFLSDRRDDADYRITRSYVPTLPQREGAHYFYDGVKCKNYAMTCEHGNHLEVLALQETLPWGLKLRQLYEEFALPHILLLKERLVLHASYICYADRAILFTAPSGTGKSTQAELWRLHRGAEILNGDRAVIGLREGVPYAFGFPMSGSSDYCVNRSLPLCAVVHLSQGPENVIRRLKGREALRVLLNGTYSDPKHPEDFIRNMNTAISLLDTPVFTLSCRPDVGAVEALEEALG